MAIYKRGNVYWYSFRFNGERFQESTKTKNRRAAELIETKAKNDLALGEYGLTPLKAGPPLVVYADTFRAYVDNRNSKHPATIAYYKEKLLRLLEYRPMAACRLNLIDEALIERYVAHRLKTVQLASVNRELATLRRLLRVAWKVHKLIRGVPDIPMIPGEVGRDFVLTYDQEKEYLGHADSTLRDFALLSLDTGCRAQEGISLKWENVRLDPAPYSRLGCIHVVDGKSQNAKRTLSLTQRVNAMLALRRRFHPKAVYVFPSPRKNKTHILVTSLDHLHSRTRDRVNGDEKPKKLPDAFVVHSLRHTFATRLGESGADAFTIMRILGHADVQTSQKYVHKTPDSLERTFERLDAMNKILRGDAEAEAMLGVSTVSATFKNGVS